jgi:hypothetical protein
MDRNHPVVEPNFEGTPMRMPSVGSNRPEAPVKSSSLLTAPIIILLFLILAAILGGFYYWYTIVMSQQVVPVDTTRPTAEQNKEPESTTAVARTQIMDVVSTSDELSAIKADAETTNLADLDSEINPIEGELNAAQKIQ